MMVSHLSATSSMVRLCGQMVILVRPPWLILGAMCVGDCVEYGSSVIPMSLVSPPSSLILDSWADVDDFLEEVRLYGPTVGNFCPDYCNFVGHLASLFVPQSDNVVMQVLDTAFNRTNQKLFGWV